MLKFMLLWNQELFAILPAIAFIYDYTDINRQITSMVYFQSVLSAITHIIYHRQESDVSWSYLCSLTLGENWLFVLLILVELLPFTMDSINAKYLPECLKSLSLKIRLQAKIFLTLYTTTIVHSTLTERMKILI